MTFLITIVTPLMQLAEEHDPPCVTHNFGNSKLELQSDNKMLLTDKFATERECLSRHAH
jgi:hypothetical protein